MKESALLGSMALALTMGALPAMAQTPATTNASANYECVAGAHCNVSCIVDGDKAFQTGNPKTITLTVLAPNNYLVDLVEQGGETQHLYVAGSKIICDFEGMNKLAK